jgi:hypothetical protein
LSDRRVGGSMRAWISLLCCRHWMAAGSPCLAACSSRARAARFRSLLLS